MRISQDRLLAFYEVTKLNSFTEAAKAIGITQSALSHRVKNLETDLKVTLFIRDPSGLRLTEAGERLLKYCQVQIKIEDEFVRDLTEEHTPDLRGAIRIGSVSSLAWSIITPAIGDLFRENPSLHLDLLAKEVTELPNLLRRNRVDFIITVEKLNDASLEEFQLGYEKYVLIESSKIKTKGHAYIDHEEKDRFTYDFFMHQGKKDIRLKRIFMEDNHGLLAGVKEGFGRAVVSQHLIKNDSELKVIPKQKVMKKEVYLYFPKQPFYTRLHDQVVGTLCERVPELLR